ASAHSTQGRLHTADGASADVPISDERKRLLEWSGTSVPYPRDSSISALFEAQAARTPDARAVVGPDQQLSYADLDARANRLARLLKARGVGPDVVVGLCLERSVEQVVALLAILKAGGAYLPLDPSDPELRLATAIDSAGSRVVVTSRALLQTSPVSSAIRARPVLVDEVSGDDDGSSRGLEPPAAESLAYTLFTSGSTGRPKAVAVPHRAVVRLVYGLPDVPLGEGETVLHLAP